MNVEDLIVPCQRQAMKLKILKFYDWQCCLTGRYHYDYCVDLAHIFDAGLSKFSWLRDVPLNTIPVWRNLHSVGNDCLDFVGRKHSKREPRQKMQWIFENLPEDWKFRNKLLKQFNLLVRVVDEY